MSENYFLKKSRIIFYQFLILGSVLVFFLGVLFWHIYPSLLLIRDSLLNRLIASCGCTNHFSFYKHPFIFSTLIFTGLIGGLFLGFFIYKIVKVRKATKKFIQLSLKNKRQSLSSKLKRVVRATALEDNVIEIYESEPIIFCFNFIKPKICISTAVVNRLSEDELQAVLMHEKHHLINHDPAKILVIKAISKLLFFIPGLKKLVKQYSIFSELAADRVATDSFKNKSPLAKALYKIFQWQEQSLIKKNLAVSFLGEALSERVNTLTNSSYIPKHRTFTPGLIVNLMCFSLIVFFSNFLLNLDHSFLQNSSTGQCLASLSGEVCEMSEQSSTCTMESESAQIGAVEQQICSVND